MPEVEQARARWEKKMPQTGEEVTTDREESMATAKTKWVKAPSVTTGGKTHFYTAMIDGNRYWVVWSRIARKWMVTMEVRGEQATLGYVKSPEEGKRIAKKLAQVQKAKRRR